MKNDGVKVSWDDDIPNIWKNNQNVPNHQPVIYVDETRLIGFKPFQRCFEKYWMINTKICVLKQKRSDFSPLDLLVCSRWKLDITNSRVSRHVFWVNQCKSSVFECTIQNNSVANYKGLT